MQVTQTPSLADQIRTLPAQGAGRDRQMRRLIHLHASGEAAAALHAAAARAGGVSAAVLAAADTVFSAEGRSVDDAVGDRLRDAVTSPEFLSLLRVWIRELREIATTRPETGACTLATALELWLWTARNLRDSSQILDELAESICPLLAGRALVLDAVSAQDDVRTDLCHVHAARASALAGAACAELVFGYRRHLAWDAEGCASCFGGDQVDELEGFMPGFASGARGATDVVEADGWHRPKAGPCASFDGVDTFMRLRRRLDGCLTGARFAADRAAEALTRSMAALTESEG